MDNNLSHITENVLPRLIAKGVYMYEQETGRKVAIRVLCLSDSTHIMAAIA